jgi:hypothetical protein
MVIGILLMLRVAVSDRDNMPKQNANEALDKVPKQV